MSDSEDDYMSDKLLMGCEKADVRPGLLYSKSQKRKHELYKKQQEDLLKKPKTYHEQEKETRDKGLNTALAPDNKGFKMLEKMGYKAGTGLGKSTVGIVEPVAIKPKDDGSGVGRDEHVKEVVKKKQDLKEKTFKATEREFRESRAEKHNLKTLQNDYKKAQRTCEELDFKSGKKSPDLPYLWSKGTLESMKKKNKKENDESDESDSSTEGEEEGKEEEEVEEITEPKLCDMIMYLRRTYCFCIYCGDFVKDENGAGLMCPGLFRRDHDE